MTDPDWFYDTGAVIIHPETGEWWHVLSRYRDVDTNTQFYRIGDATHTEYKDRIHADWLEEWDSAGWKTNTKPAAERGYRVNGVLCGPERVDYHKDKECVHGYQCPECESDGWGELDIIHDHAEERIVCECRVCNNKWEVSDA